MAQLKIPPVKAAEFLGMTVETFEKTYWHHSPDFMQEGGMFLNDAIGFGLTASVENVPRPVPCLRVRQGVRVGNPLPRACFQMKGIDFIPAVIRVSATAEIGRQTLPCGPSPCAQDKEWSGVAMGAGRGILRPYGRYAGMCVADPHFAPAPALGIEGGLAVGQVLTGLPGQ